MYPGGLTPEVVAKITKDTPPAFMLCGADDRGNLRPDAPWRLPRDEEGRCSAWKLSREYAGVGHGFGLRMSQHGAVADWPDVFVEWMETKGFLRGK